MKFETPSEVLRYYAAIVSLGTSGAALEFSDETDEENIKSLMVDTGPSDPMAWACWVISNLSMPMSGRRMGNVVASLMTTIFSGVCDATWPRLSPVTSAPARRRLPRAVAMRTMKRRYRTTRNADGATSMICR